MTDQVFFNRDLSWLDFNHRVLLEAAKEDVPLLERIKFLSIYSSNLDEFYRVRMPVLMALDNFSNGNEDQNVFETAKEKIDGQLNQFGRILKEAVIPALEARKVNWIYNKVLPEAVQEAVAKLFFTDILAHIAPVQLELDETSFFAENNKLYQAVILTDASDNERLKFINVPSDVLPRLYSVKAEGQEYIIFLDDIIRQHAKHLFPDCTLRGVYNLKITRDAELNIEDEQDENIIAAVEKELARRDYGVATRFLCEPGIPLRHLYRIVYALNLHKASIVEGGAYHNLKDLAGFPLKDKELEYPEWPAKDAITLATEEKLLEKMLRQDIMVNTPYQNYDLVLRFFNEAAGDPDVEEIYCTLYRVATTSKIVTALITAAKSGKKVTAMLELKARFDEANNIKWASKMKDAGVKIIYSRNTLKVHAKVALVKRKSEVGSQYLGLLATGNFNEVTARFYTDHILFTSNQDILKELEALFGFLAKRKKKPSKEDHIDFEQLLVAQFNLQSKFLMLIDREMEFAKAGKPAAITIKLNNLEEKILISKLYEASNAGVKIKMIVRSICCLVAGLPGQSENITVHRIVDRYLEHGRVFIFNNGGNEEIYMGSADWMNRNIYSRIEVCFPVIDPQLKHTVREMINLQLNEIAGAEEQGPRSQEAIYQML